MLVRTIRPQPALVLAGYNGNKEVTSGRAPSMKTASPTYNCAAPPQFGLAGATSVPRAARQTVTRATSTSSRAHPVKGTAPVTPLRFSVGVSVLPNGYADVPRGFSLRSTDTGPAVLAAPERDRLIAPATVPDGGSPMAGVTAIESCAGPTPDDGLTCSQGWEVVAVQVIVPVPCCDMRIVCADVHATKDVL